MEKLDKMDIIFKKMSQNDKKVFIKYIEDLGEKKQKLDNMKKIMLEDSTNFKTQNIKKRKGIVNSIYSNEIEKVLYILSRNDLLKKINGLKILVCGETGTGKTTLIKSLIKDIKGYEVHKVVIEELISSKMGQTQLNIIKLQQELIGSQKKILFIDEVDSIISSRFNDKDLSEYHRIASSFIKLLDSINENTITIFSTNLVDKIDPAILRRMNFIIEGKTLNIKQFINFVNNEATLEWTTQQKNKIINIFKDSSFTVSELNWFINEFEISFAMGNVSKVYTFFIKHFINKPGISLSLNSNRMKEDLSKEGIIINEIKTKR